MYLFTIVILFASQAIAITLWPFSPQNALSLSDALTTCDCTGILATTPQRGRHICNNATLGPQTLPWRFPMLSLVSNYDRFGGLTPAAFLAQWRQPAQGNKSASWRWPDAEGFQVDLDYRPIKGNMTLPIGFKVDRFGEESGKFVSAADAPFSQRALPPDSLNVCPRNAVDCSPRDHPWSYHIYSVAKNFVVEAGPIAPAFGQPGGGAQFKLSQNISNLVKLGYLTPLKFSDVVLGPGGSRSCGRNPTNCSCNGPI